MNRIQFLKRLLATMFGAAIIKQSNASVTPTEREKSKRYLLSATVAGTPYYAFPEVGPQLLVVEQPEEPEPGTLIPPSLASFKEFSATLKLEPDNAFDYKAIEVYWKNHKMGYIPRRHNKVLYNLMKDGADLKAAIRLAIPTEWEESINPIHDFQYAYDLRIRVYLVSAHKLLSLD